MTSQILLLLFAGVIGSNAVAVTGTGAELALSGYNSIKNSGIFVLTIFAVTLASLLTNYLLAFLLGLFDLGGYLIYAEMFVVAMYVQIAEMVLEKTCPLFLKQAYSFVAILASVAFVLGTSALGGKGLVTDLLNLVFSMFGVFVMLTIVAGIRCENIYNGRQKALTGISYSYLILFLLLLALTCI